MEKPVVKPPRILGIHDYKRSAQLIFRLYCLEQVRRAINDTLSCLNGFEC